MHFAAMLEIRNQKHEIRNKFKIRMFEMWPPGIEFVFYSFEFWSFRFVSSFGFRYSDLVTAEGVHWKIASLLCHEKVTVLIGCRDFEAFNCLEWRKIWMHVLFLVWYWSLFSSGCVLNSEMKIKTNNHL